MKSKIPITIAKGDGIGPEIMEATLFVLKELGAPLTFEEIEVGEKVYQKGIKTGIDPKAWDIIKDTKAFLKAPITTPQGGGFKSLNVTIRTTLGLFANVRPCVSYDPFVFTKHPEMDVVIVRENEEDLYCGIEYQQTIGTTSSLKMISREGTEKICRYAFEYAKLHNRKKVTCFTKDNIMKITDGLFHQIFEEVAKDYPDILNEFWIIDIGTAKLADTPEIFDVIVLPNLYGDILSDVGAQISGSVGLVGSSNIGEHGAMFEAIHGSAPKRGGQNVANPSALMLASVMMLDHVGLGKEAALFHNAWLKTIEEGYHTYDIFKSDTSKEKVGTQEFAKKVASNLGKKPKVLKPVEVKAKSEYKPIEISDHPLQKRELVGIDVFIHAKRLQDFFDEVHKLNEGPLNLLLVTNRGVKVWPEGRDETFCIDQFRLRFSSKDYRACSMDHVIRILNDFHRLELDVIKTENLYTFDSKPGFSNAEI